MRALRLLHSGLWRANRTFPHLLSRPLPFKRSCVASQSTSPSIPLTTSSANDPSLRSGLRVRLDLHASQLIDEHREALRDVLGAIEGVPEASDRDVRLLKAEIARLGDGFFMLVVAGEYNSGKSSLINALLGRAVLPEGPTPTTERVTKVKYAEEVEEMMEDAVEVRGEPCEVLRGRLQIVDTPGTNAVQRVHEVLTREFVPLCDLVLFVTSADRPFSESERLFLQSIRDWGKKVILIVNKIDLIEKEEERDQVMQFVSSSAKTLLGNESKVFGSSARLAKQARENSVDVAGEKWRASGLAPLEEYITESLDSVERLRLKLRSSAAVGSTVAEKYMGVLEANKRVVDTDRSTVNEIETLLQRHEETVRKGYPGHFARADNVLLEVLDRADLFFDTHMRMSNVWSLSNRNATEQAFEDEVVKGTSKFVHREIRGIGEWLADLSSRNLTETTAILSRRMGQRAQEIEAMHINDDIDTPKSSLAFPGLSSGREMEVSVGRERFVTRLSEASEDVASDYISRKECKQIADKIASSVRLSTGLGIGAVGSMSAFLLNSTSLAPAVLLGDPTIPMISGVLGALGLMAMPRQKMSLRAELRGRIMNIRTRLRNELRARLEEQLTGHMEGIRDAVQPFADFSESQKRSLDAQMHSVQTALDVVRKLEEKLDGVDMHSCDEDSRR